VDFQHYCEIFDQIKQIIKIDQEFSQFLIHQIELARSSTHIIVHFTNLIGNVINQISIPVAALHKSRYSNYLQYLKLLKKRETIVNQIGDRNNNLKKILTIERLLEKEEFNPFKYAFKSFQTTLF